jgi:hypothetical protein
LALVHCRRFLECNEETRGRPATGENVIDSLAK